MSCRNTREKKIKEISQLFFLIYNGPDTQSDFDLCIAFFSGPPPFLFLFYVFTELGNIPAGK